MANDLYVYNATNQVVDYVNSILDLAKGTDKKIPPGAQGHLTFPTADALTAAIAHHQVYGSKDPGSIADITKYAGIAHSTSVHVVGSKQPPII